MSSSSPAVIYRNASKVNRVYGGMSKTEAEMKAILKAEMKAILAQQLPRTPDKQCCIYCGEMTAEEPFHLCRSCDHTRRDLPCAECKSFYPDQGNLNCVACKGAHADPRQVDQPRAVRVNESCVICHQLAANSSRDFQRHNGKWYCYTCLCVMKCPNRDCAVIRGIWCTGTSYLKLRPCLTCKNLHKCTGCDKIIGPTEEVPTRRDICVKCDPSSHVPFCECLNCVFISTRKFQNNVRPLFICQN